MKKLIFPLILVFLFSCSEKQSSKTGSGLEDPIINTLDTLRYPSSFFPTDKAKVLVVGVFHFDYPGLDEHKVDENEKIDVLLEPKKSEMNELVAYIKQFKPNKIALEANPNWNTMEKFRKYQAGELRNERDERYQLGMRIASELQLDTLYPVNSYSLWRDLKKTDSLFLNKIVGEVDWKREDHYWKYVEEWFDYDDKLAARTHLIDYLKYMNSKESHSYGYGLYLLGNFKTENNQGADNLSIWWYNRNLRIFRNIQGITSGPQDRILVIIGNGHACILRQLFEDSPEYEFIEFDSLDKL